MIKNYKLFFNIFYKLVCGQRLTFRTVPATKWIPEQNKVLISLQIFGKQEG